MPRSVREKICYQPPLPFQSVIKLFDEALKNQYIISSEWFSECPFPSTTLTELANGPRTPAPPRAGFLLSTPSATMAAMSPISSISKPLPSPGVTTTRSISVRMISTASVWVAGSAMAKWRFATLVRYTSAKLGWSRGWAGVGVPRRSSRAPLRCSSSRAVPDQVESGG